MPHLSTHHRGRSPSSNGFSTSNGGGDLGIIYNVKRSDGGRSLPRPARKTYNQHKSNLGSGDRLGTASNNQQWRSRSSEATNGGRTLMSRSVTHYAASTVASRSHQQLYPRQQAATSRSLSRSHEERALRSVSSASSAVPTASNSHHHVGGGSQRQSLTSITTLAASKNSLNQQQMLPAAVVPPPPSYGNGSSNPVIHSSLSNSVTSSTTSGSKNALAASITQQVRHFTNHSPPTVLGRLMCNF